MEETTRAVPAEIASILEQWPKEPRESAGRLIDYYGVPDEHSASQLMWHATRDGWKRTVLSREQTPHNFPSPHADFLEQFIDYRVPVEMFTPLAEFDGSVIAERTKGELSARCGGTSMNFVAINLAHDIVSGRRSVAEARAEYGRLYTAYKRGEKPSYTQAFQFEVRGGSVDPDVETIGAD
ncbi:MAG: hypothetical protein AB7H96_13680 [Vicinamibacterales bacterium]